MMSFFPFKQSSSWPSVSLSYFCEVLSRTILKEQTHYASNPQEDCFPAAQRGQVLTQSPAGPVGSTGLSLLFPLSLLLPLLPPRLAKGRILLLLPLLLPFLKCIDFFSCQWIDDLSIYLMWCWGSRPGPHACQASPLPPCHTPSPPPPSLSSFPFLHWQWDPGPSIQSLPLRLLSNAAFRRQM